MRTLRKPLFIVGICLLGTSAIVNWLFDRSSLVCVKFSATTFCFNPAAYFTLLLSVVGILLVVYSFPRRYSKVQSKISQNSQNASMSRDVTEGKSNAKSS